MTDADRFADLESRVTALAAFVKCATATLMLRGLLNKASVDEMLRETMEALRAHGAGAAAIRELEALRGELPDYLRAAMGPEPDPDDHDH